MLTPPTRSAAWRMLQHYRLEEVIFRFLRLHSVGPHPEVSAGRTLAFFDRVCPGQPIRFGPALAATTLEFSARRLPHLSKLRALLSHPTVREMVAAVRQSLRISNDEIKEMEGTLYGLELLLREHLGIVELKHFLARPTSRLSRDLLAAIPGEAIGQANRESLERRFQELSQTDYAPRPSHRRRPHRRRLDTRPRFQARPRRRVQCATRR